VGLLTDEVETSGMKRVRETGATIKILQTADTRMFFSAQPCTFLLDRSEYSKKIQPGDTSHRLFRPATAKQLPK
jgi:hypothetical protein